jgi:TonB-dependent receptor
MGSAKGTGSESVVSAWASLWVCWIIQLLSVIGCAQDGGQGGLRGRAVDSEFYQAVPGVEIGLEGTQFKVITADDGSFFLNALPPGVYTVLASRAGYSRERVSDVVVSAGAVSETEIRLTAEVVELEDFVVSMEDIIENASAISPAGLAADLQSFSTSIGSEFLEKLNPGGDIGGAVSRMAGTSVVDSRYVVIRGLSDRYNVVVLNNARLPSSDPNKRAVNIDIFPSNLVETIVSSKTFTPDMPGEATGGFLNVVTKSIPNKPFVNFSLQTGYNTQATNNPGFLQYKGGGTGFLGTARERALPGQLKVTTLETLPLSGPTNVDLGAGQFQPTPEAVRNRQLAASLLSDRPMGADTEEAPMDFGVSLAAGTVVEDFLGGRLGIVGALSYSKRYELDNGVRATTVLVPSATGPLQGAYTRYFEFQEGEEKLLAGALLTIGWQGPEQDKISLTYFTNIAAEDETVFAIGEDRSVSDPNNNLNAIEEGLPIFNETLYYTERKLSTLQLTGEHVMDDERDIKIDWAGAFSWSYQEEPDIRFSNYGYDIDQGRYFGLTSDIPGERFERIWRRLDDLNYNLNMNIEVPFGESADGKERSKLKFGGALDHSERNYVTENFAYRVDPNPATPFQVPAAFTADNRQAITLADQVTGADQVNTLPTGANSYIDSTYLARTETPPGTERYDAYQDIAAIYGMATFNLSEDVEFMFGGRVETTDMRIKMGSSFDSLDPLAGGFIFNDLITGEPIPIEEVLNPNLASTDLLPAAAASWEFAEKMTLRASVGRTIARPTFKELAPVLARDPVSGDFYVGNVRLQRSDIVNYDVRAEWFPNPGDYVILSLFSKSIRSPIESVNLGSIDSVFNEESATIYGLEIELNKKLGEWGPVLEDITLGFNYAKMTSQVQLTDFSAASRRNAGFPDTRALQGQPDYTMNFNATYDNEDFGFSMGVFLNITGELLYQVGGVTGSSLSPDVVQETYTRLDFNISKELFDDWKLSFNVGNFLNTERRREHRFGNRSLGAFEYVREGTLYAISLSKKW